MGKVEIDNFYCLTGDNWILFLQKCLLNSSPHFISFSSELVAGATVIFEKVCFSKTISRLKMKLSIHVYSNSY